MRPFRPLSAALVVTLLLAGCHAPGPDPAEPDAASTTEDDGSREAPVPGQGPEDILRNHTLAVGQHSGFHAPVREILQDEAAWRTFWRHHEGFTTNRSDPPDVDFDRHQVVAVVLGDRPDLCHHVRITMLDRSPSNERLTVEFTRYVPHDDDPCWMAVSQPHHFVVTARGLQTQFVAHTVQGLPADL